MKKFSILIFLLPISLFFVDYDLNKNVPGIHLQFSKHRLKDNVRKSLLKIGIEKVSLKPDKKLVQIALEEAGLRNKNNQLFYEKVDKARGFIYANSNHLLDENHRKYAWKPRRVMELIVEASKNKSSRKPSLTCGPRAMALQSLLSELGIKNRIIDITSDNFSNMRSHTFLEVFNPSRNTWEIVDPDFDIHYINKNTEERVSTSNIIFGDKSEIIPVQGMGKDIKVGRDLMKFNTKTEEKSFDLLMPNYFEAMGIRYSLKGDSFESEIDYHVRRKRSLILCNSEVFDLDKKYSKEGLSYREITKSGGSSGAFISECL